MPDTRHPHNRQRQADSLAAQLVAVADALGRPGLHPHTPLREAGIDSLDRVALAAAVEDATGLTVPDHALAAAVTLADLATALAPVPAAAAGAVP